MTPLPTLLDRVRKADGPLDNATIAEIIAAVQGKYVLDFDIGCGDDGSLEFSIEFTDGGGYSHYRHRCPDVSIDAALALVETVLPGCAFTIQRDWGDLNRCSISTDDITPVRPYVGDGQSLPLAILAALLSALIARQEADKE